MAWRFSLKPAFIAIWFSRYGSAHPSGDKALPGSRFCPFSAVEKRLLP
jgi:hypothetical protein